LFQDLSHGHNLIGGLVVTDPFFADPQKAPGPLGAPQRRVRREGEEGG